MSYRCGVCSVTVQRRKAMLRHTVNRLVPKSLYADSDGNRPMRSEIEREVPVCQECASRLSTASLETVYRRQLERQREIDVILDDPACDPEPLLSPSEILDRGVVD